MASSFVASFMIFVITGLHSIVVTRVRFSQDPVVNTMVFCVIFLNAIFFYYFAAQEEMEEGIRERLARAGALEWVLRLISQTTLMSIWFIFQVFGFRAFAFALIFIYVVFLIWDYVTRAVLESRSIVLLDLLGLSLTVCFLYLVNDSTELGRVLLGANILGYVVLFGWGVNKTRWNPFLAIYWSKPELH
jgi:hypothetical protein